MLLKYYSMNMVILKSNEKLHEEMINGLLRSPCSYFDTTPSGRLINTFSNDLGILDNSLTYSFIVALEGSIQTAVSVVSICQMEAYFILPLIIFVILSIYFFNYSKSAISKCKQTDLITKSPIFNFCSETMNGLTQIKIYNRR